MSLSWVMNPVCSIDQIIQKKAEERQSILTKPMGSLGKLETLAVQFATWQSTEKPRLDRVHISVFAADHGVAEEKVSAFPQVVTGEMVNNFVRGGAAISVLAKENDLDLEIVDVGVKNFKPIESVVNARVANATQNIVHFDAMDRQQLERALLAGKEAAERAKKNQAQLFIGGEMGIANTTSATAISCKLLDFLEIACLTGAGTGLDKKGIHHKVNQVRLILKRSGKVLGKRNDPLDILQVMGGFEIAALVGGFIRSAQLGLPVLVDGFITTAAALVAIKINEEMKHWMLFSHCSAEAGHIKILSALGVKPLVNLNMRLGEASGAATVVPLIRQALVLHNNMATFAEAGVST